MTSRPRSSRLLALMMGWALALPVSGAAPALAVPDPVSSPFLASPTDPENGTSGPDSDDSSGETLEGEGLSLLDGLDIEVAEVDPANASVLRGDGAEDEGGEDGEAEDLDEATAPTSASLLRERPAPAERPTVDPAVTEAVEEDGIASVIIELTGSADLASLQTEAARAGMAAATAARGEARTLSADVRDRAAEAADEARGRLVVETLRSTGAEAREQLVADLTAAGEELATTEANATGDGGSAPDVTAPVDLWVVNSVGATVDADMLADLVDRDEVAHVRLEGEVEVPELSGEPHLPTWSLEKVHAPQTWGEYGHRGEGVTVAVLDTGVEFDHPALAGTYRGRDGDHSDSWFVGTGENYPAPADRHGHGTHVTGSITGGAPGDIIGVAPDAEWIGVKILSDSGRGGETGILNGMQWVLAPGGDPAKAPDVANNSWGSGPGHNTAYWDAVAAWRAAGIVPVFANGNDGPVSGSAGSPGNYPHSFAVGATDSDDAVANFSSRGPIEWDGERYLKPQVSAPGAGIYSSVPRHLSETGYATNSGTSMASPHVAGVAALVLSANPELGVDELETLLEETARTEGFMGQTPNDAYGHGIVDAYAATTRAAHSGLIHGTVTGPDGPVAATVAVVDGPSTVADADGAYELHASPGELTVRVSAYGYATQEHTVDLELDEQVLLDVELTAQAEATLSGTVTAEGEPVGDAHVQVTSGSDATRTGEDGSYSLPVPEGTHEMRVTATGYQVWTGTVEIDGDTTLDVDLAALSLTGVETWPGLKGGGPGHGLADTGIDAASLQQQWTTNLGRVMFASPAADTHGVYQFTESGTLTALDPITGETLWTVTTGGPQRGTPAISDDGATVYVTTGSENTLIALDAQDGSTLWTHDLGTEVPTYGAPTVVDGTVYVTTGAGATGSVHAVDAATGEARWSTPMGGGAFFGPAVGEGVAVTSSVTAGTVTAMDSETGEVLWERTDTVSFTSPAIAAGRVHLGTTNPEFTNGDVITLDLRTGETLWHVEGHGDTQGSSPVLYDDLVILGSHTTGTVSAYRVGTGEHVWSHFVGAAVTSSVAVTTGGVVFGGTQSSDVFALDATTGEPLWTDRMPQPIISSTAVSDDAVVFVSRDGTVASYRSAGGLSGTVTGPDGPIEATVELVGTSHATTSDADTGAYALDAPAGDYTLRVSRYGLATHTEEITLSPTNPVVVDVTLTTTGEGSVTGTVTDADGAPLAGATVALPDTPVEDTTTGQDGTFTLSPVADGTWELQITLAGYAPHTEEVTVETDGTVDVEVVLGGFDLAVVADHRSQLSEVLRGQGWSVDELTWAESADAPGSYDAMILNGTSADDAREHTEVIGELLAGADAAGTSIIALDNFGGATGSVDEVLAARGTGGTLETQSTRGGSVWLTETVEHPVTAPIDQDRYPVLRDYQHGWLVDYEGASLATLGSDQQGPRGTGIGYERTGPDAVQVLLPSFAASPLVGPDQTWTEGAEAVFLASVEHAVAVEFGTVALTVTGPDGEPVDARVSVVDSFERQDLPGGTGDLLLPAGEHTLRISAAGMASVTEEVTVTVGGTTPVEVSLTASEGGTLAGTVTDGAGHAVAGATITVGDLETTTGADGSYTVTDLEPGSYPVTVTAEGYLATEIPEVEITAGAVTELDVELLTSPVVAVVGDHQSRMTDFLTAAGVRAEETGWEVMDALETYDVVVLHNPEDVTAQEWRENLEAFDAAGVSVILPAANNDFTTSGVHALADVTDALGAVVSHGGYGTSPKELTGIVEHPITASLGAEPVVYLNAGSDAPWFQDYEGVVLAEVGMDGEVAGPGIAYDVRTPDSVHVLLSGLFVGGGHETDVEWAEEGRALMLDAVRYAAEPRLAQVTGTVLDAQGNPVPDATIEVEGRSWSATGDADGRFLLGLPDGEHTLRIGAFGYETVETTITTDGSTQDLEVVLELGAGGTLTGTVTSAGLLGTGATEVPAASGAPLEGAVVRVVGTALETVTDDQGRYTVPRVLAGEQELEIEAEGHQRLRHPFTMPDGDHVEDVTVLESARVAVIADSTSGVHAGRLVDFLTDWGYVPVEVAFDDTAALADVDMVLVNDPYRAADDLPAFLDAVNRQDLPVVWAGNYGRGVIRELVRSYGDPEAWVEGTLDGAVTTTVTADHPLTAGLAETFAPTAEGRMYGGFTGWSGTTVATIASDEGPAGDTIAYDGRTAGSVDVLLSTSGASNYGAVGTRDLDEFYFTPETSRSLANALQWALTADGLGADTRGTLVSESGTPLEGTVTVEETGRTYPARAGDGAYVIPLEPGTWTLTGEAFGHDTATTTVQITEGESTGSTITLPVTPGSGIRGTVVASDGAAVADAQVSVEGTDHTATSGADGSFTLPHLPAGDWVVVAEAEGHVTAFEDVTVTDGEDAVVEIRMGATAHLALVGDMTNDSMAAFLTGHGYTIEEFNYNQLDQVDVAGGGYDLVFLNGNGSAPTEEAFTGFFEETAAHDMPVVMPSQYGSGAIRHLSSVLGDPESVKNDFEAESIGYQVTEAHPVLEGYEVGETITLVTRPGSNQQFQSFAGYSGTVLADVVHPGSGAVAGNGLAYRFDSPGSVHLLLGTLGASSYASPVRGWTFDAERITLNGVAWALEARQSAVAGVVTSGGEPVEDAEVTVAGTATRQVTGPDGAYQVGVAPGEVVLEVDAEGHEPYSATLTVGEEETVQHDVELTPLASSSLTVTVVDDETGEPVPDARVAVEGPTSTEATTDADGVATLDPVLVGDYEVDVEGPFHVAATAEVTVGPEATELTVPVTAATVAVLGDVEGDLTAFLLAEGVASQETTWDGVADELAHYDVVVVNGGRPGADQFSGLVAGADEAGVNLVFTGTYGVTEGGIRLLEAHDDGVTVGGHGYRDGAVGLTDLADHPVVAGLEDPTPILAEDSYYSWLSEHRGEALATLTVDGEPTGTAIAFEERTEDSGHLLLSFAAVTEYLGPDRGWTPETGRVMVDALEWLLTAPPAVPTLLTDEPLVGTSTVPVHGTAGGADTVTVRTGEEDLVTVPVDDDGAWSATVVLPEGEHELVAVATNAAGSATSEPLVVTVDLTPPELEWTPGEGLAVAEPEVTVAGRVSDTWAEPVAVTVQGEPVEVAADGTFSVDVPLEVGIQEIAVTATDTVGHTITDSREVLHHPVELDWHVPGNSGQVRITLSEGDSPYSVSGADLELLDGGEVVETVPMERQDSDRYRARLKGVVTGTFDLRAVLEVEGFELRIDGPQVRIR